MLVGILMFLIVLIIVFAILSFTVHHLFLIALIIAVILAIGHGGFFMRRS